MKTTRFTDEQIIGFLKQAEAGMSIKDICRTGGFSQPTFYKWRSRYERLGQPTTNLWRCKRRWFDRSEVWPYLHWYPSRFLITPLAQAS